MVSDAPLPTCVLGKPYLPPLFFFSGVTYDIITLTRIDRLRQSAPVPSRSLLGLSHCADRIPERRTVEDLPPDAPRLMRWIVQAKPYAPMAIQFLLGGLFSSYTRFSIPRAYTFTGTAVFFCLLVGFLVANEFLRNRLSNVQLLVGLYAPGLFDSFTMFLPVMTGLMNQAIFSRRGRTHGAGGPGASYS